MTTTGNYRKADFKKNYKAISFNAKRHINLGKYIVDLRKYNGITQFQLHELTDIANSFIAGVELGRGTFKPGEWKRLAKRFNMSTALLNNLRTVALNQLTLSLKSSKTFGGGAYVRLLRRSNKVSMVKMAKILELDYWDIYDIEYNKVPFTKKQLATYIRVLNLPRNQANIVRRNNEHMTSVLSSKKRKNK